MLLVVCEINTFVETMLKKENLDGSAGYTSYTKRTGQITCHIVIFSIYTVTTILKKFLSFTLERDIDKERFIYLLFEILNYVSMIA